MYIVVKADNLQKKEFLSKSIPEGVFIDWTGQGQAEGDVYFDLLFEENGAAFPSVQDKPVFVNAVIETSNRLPVNYIRINAWNGFLERNIVEIAATKLPVGKQGLPLTAQAENILQQLGWHFQWVPDSPGMIAARIIAMLINEAYFGIGDEISTKEEMDTAMKLGTNYPYGPFEWSEKIGLKKVYQLLKKLNRQDTRYAVAPELEKAVQNISI